MFADSDEVVFSRQEINNTGIPVTTQEHLAESALISSLIEACLSSTSTLHRLQMNRYA